MLNEPLATADRALYGDLPPCALCLHSPGPARRKTEAGTIALLQSLGYDEVMRIEQT
jgi:hypothetical protein